MFEAAARAIDALAAVSSADPDGPERLVESSPALERLTGEQLATRVMALWMHGRARRGLGAVSEALADLERGAGIAARTGRERVLMMLRLETAAVLVELGRLEEALAAAQEGVELARLMGNPPALLWALSALSAARLAAGDIGGGLADAGEAVALGARGDFPARGQPGWCLGAALTAAGEGDRAIAAMLDAFGGPRLAALAPVDRPAAAADLAEAHLARGDVAAAEGALAAAAATGSSSAPVGDSPVAATDAPWPTAVTAAARAGVLLARGRPQEALAAARAGSGGPPLTAARARLAEGRALAALGERAAAVAALTEAEAALHAMGARRRRDEAVRELRRLGRRVPRPRHRRQGRRPAHRPRAGDRGPRGGRAHEPRDRRAARPEHPHDRGSLTQHLRQTRGPIARRTGARTLG